MAIKWKHIHHVTFLTIAHEDVLVEEPLSRGHIIKLNQLVLDYKYKTGVDRANQMLSHYSFQRKTIKLWKKHSFHLFDMVVVNAHILCTKTSKKKMSLEIFHEKVTKGSLARAVTEIQVQGQTSSRAGRLVWRDHFVYRIPVTHAEL